MEINSEDYDLEKVVVYHKWFIRPFQDVDFEGYVQDIDNIHNAYISSQDESEYNYNFDEACFMLVNSIRTFTTGYFDCAIYSLRQSIEVSIGSLFLSSSKPSTRRKWNENMRVFTKQNMQTFLSKENADYQELHTKLTSFFDILREKEEQANKYIHKQGVKTFHRYRNSGDGHNTSIDSEITKFFTKYLELAISAVAIYRLYFDPMPLLLSDDQIALKVPDIVTERYSDDFIEKYLSNDVVAAYKESYMYTSYYDYFIVQESKSEAVYNIVHHQFVDRGAIGEIEKQLHLLSSYDKCAVDIFMSSKKISDIYLADGCHWYFSDTRGNNKGNSIIFGTNHFEKQFTENIYNNVVYQKTEYISKIKINEKWCYIKHISPFTEEEFNILKTICT